MDDTLFLYKKIYSPHNFQYDMEIIALLFPV